MRAVLTIPSPLVLVGIFGRVCDDVRVPALRGQEVVPDLAITPVVEIGTLDWAARLGEDRGHGTVAARAFPNIAAKSLIVDQGERRPTRRRIEVPLAAFE